MSCKIHVPVLSNEILEIVRTFNISSVIDCTFGAGGHSRLFQDLNVLKFAMDRDKTVTKYNTTGIQLFIDVFSNLENYIKDENVDLIHCDLGLSMMQITDSDRGFSFMHNGPLSMSAGMNDKELYESINQMKVAYMENILNLYGDLKNAKNIAKKIEIYRAHSNIMTTRQLADACGSNNYSELAKIFQAFRVDHNKEIDELKNILRISKNRSKMTSIITFNSLEARIVKSFFRENNMKIKTYKPSESEILSNHSSRSAVMYLGYLK